MTEFVVEFRGTVYEKGYGMLPQKAMRDKTLSGNARLIYAYLCSFAGSIKDPEDGRNAFPKVETCCAELSMSDNTFYKYRRELLDRGYITKKRIRKEGSSRWEKTIYYIEAVPEIKEIKTPIPEPENPQKEPKNPHRKIYGMEKSLSNRDSSPHRNSFGVENLRGEESSGRTDSGTKSISKPLNSTSHSFKKVDDDDKETRARTREIDQYLTSEMKRPNSGYNRLREKLVHHFEDDQIMQTIRALWKFDVHHLNDGIVDAAIEKVARLYQTGYEISNYGSFLAAEIKNQVDLFKNHMSYEDIEREKEEARAQREPILFYNWLEDSPS